MLPDRRVDEPATSSWAALVDPRIRQLDGATPVSATRSADSTLNRDRFGCSYPDSEAKMALDLWIQGAENGGMAQVPPLYRLP